MAAGHHLDLSHLDLGSTWPPPRPGMAPAKGASRLDGSRLAGRRQVLSSKPELDEARRCEVAVKGKSFGDAPCSHQGKARGIDERILALITPPKPVERFLLETSFYPLHIDMRRTLQGVEETDRGGVPGTSAKKGSRSPPGHDWR